MSDQQQPLMIRLLSASVAVANRAGSIIRDVLKSGQLGVVQKVGRYRCMRAPRVSCRTWLMCCSVVQGYDDPQTEADRRAERCIVATLTTRFPHITVIGEEVSLALHRAGLVSLLQAFGRDMQCTLGQVAMLCWTPFWHFPLTGHSHIFAR